MGLARLYNCIYLLLAATVFFFADGANHCAVRHINLVQQFGLRAQWFYGTSLSFGVRLLGYLNCQTFVLSISFNVQLIYFALKYVLCVFLKIIQLMRPSFNCCAVSTTSSVLF